MIITAEHEELGEFPMPGIVPKLSRTPGKVKTVGVEYMGKHNQEVYGALLGYSEMRLGELKERKVI